MTEFTHSLVGIVPVDDVPGVIETALEAGYSVAFDVGLSANAAPPASHYGFVTVVRPAFLSLLGSSEDPRLDNAVFDSQPRTDGEGLTHFLAALSAQGLSVVEAPGP